MHDHATDADVVVVGAGPGGSATAAHLAATGRDVVLVDKDVFPREKVCGDGLTPRVVQELALLGLHREASGEPEGWAVQRGLRINGGHTSMELPWPTLADWPAYGMTCTREVFDETLVRHAQARGAQLWEQTRATGLVRRDDRGGRVAGIRWQTPDGDTGVVRAAVVVAADGASGALARSIGVRRRTDRPMAVAVRTYYETPASKDDWMTSYLDLRDAAGGLLPGYGWIFPLDDGTVNLGLGLLDTARSFREVSYPQLLRQWAGGLAAEWGTDPQARRGSVRSGPIPMGINRTPLHTAGLVLVGDSGGMVNPFNGEGISYAMEAGRFAAEVIDQAFRHRSTATLDRYDVELRRRWGGYFALGATFATLVGDPRVMHVCTEYGMPYRWLMELVLKLMAHLTDREPSDVKDAIINSLQRLAPAA